MALGVLADQKLEHVPGTAPLSHKDNAIFEVPGFDERLLKHDTTGTIVLIPQPSSSCNDPYNWSQFKKARIVISFILASVTVGVVAPVLAPAYVTLAHEWNITLTKFVLGTTGSSVAGSAFASLFVNTLSIQFGKRPLYLMAAIGLMIGSFWGAASHSFTSYVASRTWVGIWMAPLEALVPTTIADVWFVHERGFYNGLFNFAFMAGVNLATPISGPIIQSAGWRAALWGHGGFSGFVAIVIFFFMPETAFHRDSALDIDVHAVGTVEPKPEPEPETKAEGSVEQAESPASNPVSENSQGFTDTPTPYWRELLPWSGYYHPVSYHQSLWQCVRLFACPTVLWACLTFTIAVSCLVLVSLTISQIFAAPPYNFSIRSVGAVNVSSFVATLLGAVIAGPLLDGLSRHMSKSNKGIFEPEFRLPAMIVYICTTATGYFAWGQALYAEDPWPVPVIVCLGLISIGVQISIACCVTYVIDCHRDKAPEVMAVMNLSRNAFALGMSFYVNDWLVEQGVRYAFFTMGGIHIGVALLAIPMYIWGKRARSFAFRHGLSE